MNKIGAIIITIGAVTMAYLILLVVMPFLTDVVATANATMNATSNMSLYPGTSAGIISVPWILFFVPGSIGMIVIVMILRKP